MNFFKKQLYNLHIFLNNYFHKKDNQMCYCNVIKQNIKNIDVIDIHKKEKKALVNILNNIENDDFKKLEILFFLEAFLSTNEHITVNNFMVILKGKNRESNFNDAKNALNLFVDLGFAEKNLNADGLTIYEHKHPHTKHDHLFCINCGKTIEFVNKKIERIIEDCALRQNFIPISHSFKVHGLCYNCKENRGDKMPLSAAVAGEEIIIIDILGESAFKKHLVNLGLHKGVELTIMGLAKDSVIVLFGETRLAFAYDTAKHILIKPKKNLTIKMINKHYD